MLKPPSNPLGLVVAPPPLSSKTTTTTTRRETVHKQSKEQSEQQEPKQEQGGGDFFIFWTFSTPKNWEKMEPILTCAYFLKNGLVQHHHLRENNHQTNNNGNPFNQPTNPSGDRLALHKVVTSMARNSLKSPMAECLLIRCLAKTDRERRWGMRMDEGWWLCVES